MATSCRITARSHAHRVTQYNTLPHRHTHSCNTNVYINNSGQSIGIGYSVVLMNRTPYFLCDGNHNIEATEIIGEAKTLVRKASQLTGKLTEIIIGIDIQTFFQAFDAWDAGEPIQDAFPTLSADEREFIKTGITPQEWDAMFGED